MSTPLPLFPTTVVGSMPRPQYVKDLLGAGSRTGEHDAGWQRRMDDAVRFVIGMQEQAGIDIISDGEWRRETYVDVIAEMLDGFRWVKRDEFAYHQVVCERVTPRRPQVHQCPRSRHPCARPSRDRLYLGSGTMTTRPSGVTWISPLIMLTISSVFCGLMPFWTWAKCPAKSF